VVALIIIGLVAGLIAVLIGDDSLERNAGKEHWTRFMYALLVIGGFICFTIGSVEAGYELGDSDGYDQGQIDALSGIQTHEQFLVYPTGDTIPSDTLYLPIRE